MYVLVDMQSFYPRNRAVSSLYMLTKWSDDRCGETVCDDHCKDNEMPGILYSIEEIPLSSLRGRE